MPIASKSNQNKGVNLSAFVDSQGVIPDCSTEAKDKKKKGRINAISELPL